jgi:hypothetical protein
MKFRKSIVAVAVTGLVALAGPAWSSGPHDVGVDGDTSGTPYFFSATSTDAHFGILAFGFIPFDWYCDAITFFGTVNTGVDVSGADAATITSSTWSNCDYAGNPWTHTPDHTPSWSIDLTGSASAATSDVVAGDLSGLNLNIDISSPACNFDVTGSMDLSFDEANQRLQIDENDGSLFSSNPGCSLFSQGDPMSFDATFDLDAYATLYDLVEDNPIAGTPITIS